MTQTADVTLTAAQVEQIKAALVIPTCWNPRLRDAAYQLLDQQPQQQSLLAETGAA